MTSVVKALYIRPGCFVEMVRQLSRLSGRQSLID